MAPEVSVDFPRGETLCTLRTESVGVQLRGARTKPPAVRYEPVPAPSWSSYKVTLKEAKRRTRSSPVTLAGSLKTRTRYGSSREFRTSAVGLASESRST